MKKLLTACAAAGLALTAIAATPAMAQDSATGHASMRQGSQHDMLKQNAWMPSDSAYGAYAYAPQSNGRMTADGNMMQGPGSVYANGEYRGTDPDPTIRLQLWNSVPSSEF